MNSSATCILTVFYIIVCSNNYWTERGYCGNLYNNVSGNTVSFTLTD